MPRQYMIYLICIVIETYQLVPYQKSSKIRGFV